MDNTGDLEHQYTTPFDWTSGNSGDKYAPSIQHEINKQSIFDEFNRPLYPIFSTSERSSSELHSILGETRKEAESNFSVSDPIVCDGTEGR